MSTIASPRASTSVRSPSSSRTSPDIPASRATNPRRNRAALRDYYGLKSAAPVDASSRTQGESALRDEGEPSKLDKEGFDAPAYVKDILAKEGLEGVLKVESSLISEIKGLDGERKALVYDNYSKLIAATDTIRKMRTNMDPLTPATSTLDPAISHIAETAAALSSSLLDRTGNANDSNTTEAAASSDPDTDDIQKQRQTVRWVLDTPRRLRAHMTDGQRDAAEADWDEVRKLLDKWKGVKGVEELRRQCETALEAGDSA